MLDSDDAALYSATVPPVRVTPAEKEMIESARRLRGEKISDFVRDALVARSEAVLADAAKVSPESIRTSFVAAIRKRKVK